MQIWIILNLSGTLLGNQVYTLGFHWTLNYQCLSKPYASEIMNALVCEKPYFVLAHHASFIRWGTWGLSCFEFLQSVLIPWPSEIWLRPRMAGKARPIGHLVYESTKACVSSRCRNWLPASSPRPWVTLLTTMLSLHTFLSSPLPQEGSRPI